jgi:hypothetical protein
MHNIRLVISCDVVDNCFKEEYKSLLNFGVICVQIYDNVKNELNG